MAHRILLAAAAALAVFTVAGCDINTGAPKPAQSTCNCGGAQPPPQASVPPAPESYAPPEHRHHAQSRHYADRGHDRGAHSYYWRRSYSEVAVQTYDYHSDSSSTVIGDDGDRRDYHHEGHEGGDANAGAEHGEGWVDGYGRRHDGGEASIGEPVHDNGRGDGARLHPWHGYDADCPDDDSHHH
jgi:hypothetical protein